MQNIIRLLPMLCLVAGLSIAPLSTAQVFSSDVKRTALVELYTSEGCSSCPPADKWLSQLKQSPKLWKTFVPVAFHVDYWDYLGWNDRFATAEYSQRQRRYAAENAEKTVYTPGVRIGGEEFRGWQFSNLQRLEQGSDVGVLSVNIDEAGNVIAEFDSKLAELQNTHLNIAILAMNVTTNVKNGENHGRQLTHDFIVIDHITVNGVDHKFNTILSNKFLAPKNKQSYALAAWVSTQNSLLPLQATGGFLSN